MKINRLLQTVLSVFFLLIFHVFLLILIQAQMSIINLFILIEVSIVNICSIVSYLINYKKINFKKENVKLENVYKFCLFRKNVQNCCLRSIKVDKEGTSKRFESPSGTSRNDAIQEQRHLGTKQTRRDNPGTKQTKTSRN